MQPMESLPNRSDVYILNGVGNNSSQSILNTINFRRKKNFQRTNPVVKLLDVLGCHGVVFILALKHTSASSTDFT